MELLGGFRWIHFFDRFRMTQFFTDDFDLPAGGMESLLSQTSTNQVGPEVGIYLAKMVSPCLFSAEAKVGTLASFGQMDITDVFTNDDPFSIFLPSNTIAASAQNTNLSVIASLQLSARYNVYKNFVWYAGYEFFYGSRFAFATDQLDTNLVSRTGLFLDGTVANPKVNQDGQLFLHGLSVGFELYW